MLHNRDAPRVLGLARIVVFSIWIVWVMLLPIERLASVHPAMFSGVGPWRFAPDFMFNETLLWSFRWVLVGMLALTALGVRPFTPIALVTCGGILAYDSLMKSFQGNFNHAQAGLLLASLVLAIFPAADALSVMGRARHRGAGCYAAPMFACGVVLAFTYMFIGARRLQIGRLEVFTGDAILVYLGTRSLSYGTFQFDLVSLVLSSAWLGVAVKIGFALTTVAEIVTPLVLVNKRIRQAWLLVIVPFHVLTWLTMNIRFWENLLLIFLFLTPLPYVIMREAGVMRERALEARPP